MSFFFTDVGFSGSLTSITPFSSKPNPHSSITLAAACSLSAADSGEPSFIRNFASTLITISNFSSRNILLTRPLSGEEVSASRKSVIYELSAPPDSFIYSPTTLNAAGGNADSAVKLIVADKLQDLMQIQVDAIKNIKIDKVTVWDSGNAENGGSSTANFLAGMMKSIPPMSELFKQAGMELPEYLGKEIKEDVVEE